MSRETGRCDLTSYLFLLRKGHLPFSKDSRRVPCVTVTFCFEVPERMDRSLRVLNFPRRNVNEDPSLPRKEKSNRVFQHSPTTLIHSPWITLHTPLNRRLNSTLWISYHPSLSHQTLLSTTNHRSENPKYSLSRNDKWKSLG